jgi:hypothetical protein
MSLSLQTDGVSPARLIAIWETEEITFQARAPLVGAIGPSGVLLGSGDGLGGGMGEGRRELWGRRVGWGIRGKTRVLHLAPSLVASSLSSLLCLCPFLVLQSLFTSGVFSRGAC